MSRDFFLIDTCESTSSELAHLRRCGHDPDALIAQEQTAGRGQRGNSWEAEPNKNVTASMFVRAGNFEASRQFELSMVVALTTADFIDRLLTDVDGQELKTKIKWPNDIYVGDKKIAGILIECTLEGTDLSSAIVGVGINIDQERFVSDAPNPVSVKMLTGRSHNTAKIAWDYAETLLDHIYAYLYYPDPDELHADYMSRLYRFDNKPHTFIEPGGEPFEAAIVDVGTDGMMTLSNGRRYAFKEIAYII